MNWLKIAATALVALSLGACATVSSNYGNSRADQKGQAYYLPKGLIQVRVVEIAGQFDVTIAGPIMVADPNFRLHADLRKPAFSDNDAVIKVDPSTQLLTSAEITSVGQANQIVENIYNATTGYAAFRGGGIPVEVFSGLYEPSDLETASREASAALVTYFQRTCGEDGRSPVDPGRYPDCERFLQLGIDKPGMVKLEVQGPIGASTKNDNIGKCGRGLCYRPLVPVKIRAVIADTYVTDDFYMLPDTSTISYYTLPAGMFATQGYSLTFEQGVLVTSDQKQRSELLGITSLPTNILRDIIKAPVDAIRGDRDDDDEDGDPQGGDPYSRAAFGAQGPAGPPPPPYFRENTVRIGQPSGAGSAQFQGNIPASTSPPSSFNAPGTNQPATSYGQPIPQGTQVLPRPVQTERGPSRRLEIKRPNDSN